MIELIFYRYNTKFLSFHFKSVAEANQFLWKREDLRKAYTYKIRDTSV